MTLRPITTETDDDDQGIPGTGSYPSTAHWLTSPPKIGRFIYLESLDRGGMGEIIVAYDPKLDRRVALKLLLGGNRRNPGRLLRLRREAQAMARLSRHPNVVTIYEVGESEDQLFLAMEFVKGQNLRVWLASQDRPPSWRTLVGMFLQAGRGLAAVHAAGMVHRDVKPDNIFVGDDGRVQVGDFGLARQSDEEDAEVLATRSQARTEESESALVAPLTRTGTRLGTPGYIAPEQYLGLKADERTDQFAFCVALWEALYGHRPYSGGSANELVANVTTGVRVPSANGGVPVWLRRVIDRGLSTSPADRYPSINALLAALAADPTRRRWMQGLTGGVLVAAVATGIVMQVRHTRAVEACEGLAGEMDDVWNASKKEAMHEALLATEVSYAATSAATAEMSLDEYASLWKRARVNVCKSEMVEREWGRNIAEPAEACLEDRRERVQLLVDFLSGQSRRTDGAGVIRGAVSAVKQLPPLDPCLDETRLKGLPSREGEFARQEVHRLHTLLLEVDTLLNLGNFKEALTLADEVQMAADTLKDDPLRAAVAFRRGRAHDNLGEYEMAEDALRLAFILAGQTHTDEVFSDAAASLARTVGVRRNRFEDGLFWGQIARMLLDRAGASRDDLRRVRVLRAVAGILKARGNLANARDAHEQVLAAYERILGPEHPDTLIALQNLANTRRDQGELAGARESHERAFATLERTLGMEHPDTLTALDNLAGTMKAQGELAAAREARERVYAAYEHTLGSEHLDTLRAEHNLANTLRSLGDVAGARLRYERVLAARGRILGIEHLDTLSPQCQQSCRLHREAPRGART